jgi:hypothetical protein
MEPFQTAERIKKLKIEPINDKLFRFIASLEDISYCDTGQEFIHKLSIDGTISLPDLVIQTAEPFASHQPYPQCSASLDPVRRLVGLTIGPGFRARVQNIMGRTSGCTHFTSLALDLAGAHTLTLFLRMRQQVSFDTRNGPEGAWTRVGLSIEPKLENACIALTTESPVIKRAKVPLAPKNGSN